MDKEVLSKSLTLRTTPKVKKYLKSEAKRKGLSVSQIINDAIKNRGMYRKYAQRSNLPLETELPEIEREELTQSDRDLLRRLGFRKAPTLASIINFIRENPEKVLGIIDEKDEQLLYFYEHMKSIEDIVEVEKELEKEVNQCRTELNELHQKNQEIKKAGNEAFRKFKEGLIPIPCPKTKKIVYFQIQCQKCDDFLICSPYGEISNSSRSPL